MDKKKLKKITTTTLFYLAVAFIAVIILLPIYFLFSISLMSDQEAYNWPIPMAPSFVNKFIIMKSAESEDKYVLSVYSKTRDEYITIYESANLDDMISFAERKTNSRIPKDLLLQKIEGLENVYRKNESEIKAAEEELKDLNRKVRSLNSQIRKYRKKIEKIIPEMTELQELKKSLEEKINELENQKDDVERRISELTRHLISIGSVSFTVPKNLFANYITFFKVTSDSIPALIRSIEVALATIGISLGIGGLAGYAFARYFFKGKNLLKLSVLFVRMFPGVSIAMPMVIILAKMGFYDRPIGLSLVYSVGQIAMTIWITASIFMGIPIELEEAAQIFGCSKWGAFFHVTLPLALPGLAASAMYAFIGSWSETAQAIILTQFNPTFPVVVYQTLVGAKGLVNLVAAGGVTMALPAILFTIIIRRYILQMWGGITI